MMTYLNCNLVGFNTTVINDATMKACKYGNTYVEVVVCF